MDYRPEIDGLRAVAVIPVIFYHAGFDIFQGGFIGVDVFFVISGYLISMIIYPKIIENKFSFLDFYERRARRLFPALALIVISVIPFAWFTLLPSDMVSFSKSLVSVFTFSSNILFWSESGYWDTASELKPLLHTWSLSIEEQFYLLFPILLFLIIKIKKSFLTVSIVIIGLISFLISCWATFEHPDAAFYLLPSRAWELVIGVVVALIQIKNPIYLNRRSSEILGFIGLVMVITPVFYLDRAMHFPGIHALSPTVGTALIIIFTNSHTIGGRLLSWHGFRLIGLMSYSLYLWHQPIMAIVKYQSYPEPSMLKMFFVILLIFPISYLSWKFIESPFRSRRIFSKKQIFKTTITFSIIFIAFGIFGVYSKGFNSRNSNMSLKVLKYEPDNDVLKQHSWSLLKRITNDKTYFVGNNPVDDSLWFDISNEKKKLLIIGNSHSKDVFNVLYYSKYPQSKLQIARYGLQIHELNDFEHAFYKAPNYKQSDFVMIVSRYTNKDIEVLKKVIERIQLDQKIVIIIKNIFEFEDYGIRTKADYMIQRFIWDSKDISQQSIDSIIAIVNESHFTDLSDEFNRSQKPNKLIDEIYDESDHLIVLDRMDYICDSRTGHCFMINKNLEKYFWDYGHHTLAGAEFYGARVDTINWLDPILHE